MKRSYLLIKYISLPALLLFLLVGCEKKDAYTTPVPKDVLQNDALKRKLGPNIVGDTIDFVYAMAILPSKGKLTSAEATASIDGATGTYMENRSFSTSTGGVDVPVTVGTPSVTSKNVTTVTFNKDTSAAALRYYYVIPEAARGQKVSFTFTAHSSNGETVSYKLGPYTISTMDAKRFIPITDGTTFYLSIANMAVYNAADAAANAAKVDAVYLYRNLTTSAFNHALVSPGADAQYLPGVTLPAGVNNSTKMLKVFSLQDFNLAYGQNGIYIDDLDFQQIDLSNVPNYAINLKNEAGVWMETADGKYRAYVYINSVDNAGKKMTIGIKRYTVPGK